LVEHGGEELQMAVADPGVQPEVPFLSDRDRVLALTSQVEAFALQVESMAVRHPQLAAECAELSARMRSSVREHRTAIRQSGPTVPDRSSRTRDR
jgi:hypothetical protein